MQPVEITVSAQGLWRKFGSQSAVSDVTIELRRGEILGFLGPNGAGKTTTMQMLTGNLAPSAGEIKICGIDLLERPVDAKSRLGYLPELPPLYRELTVREYLSLVARLHRVSGKNIKQAVDEAMSRCSLTAVDRKLIGTLSKGYQQRVGIAQAIVHKPDVVILDEPTVGLDPNQILEIRKLIRELGKQHSVILSTHILPEVETICDRVQILHKGTTLFNDNIGALKQFNSGSVLMLGLKRPPALSEISSVPGVQRVEADGDQVFRVSCSAETEIAEALAQRAAEKSWGLFHLAPLQSSLEDVFVEITRKDNSSK